MEKSSKPIIYEFLVWDNCKNHCRFCFLKEGKQKKTILDSSKKTKVFKDILQYISSPFLFQKGSHVLLCGGEIFDTSLEESRESWNDLVESLINSMLVGYVGDLYLNTNLLYDINVELKSFLDAFNTQGLLSRVHFTTSYDLVGRFKDGDSRKLFLDNLVKVRELYPTLPIYVNMILTKTACNMIAEKDFSVKDFQDTYNVKLNVIPYIVSDEQLAPTCEEVEKALKTIHLEIEGFLYDYVDGFIKGNPRKVLKYSQEQDCFLDSTAEKSSCGHSINFKNYNKTYKTCYVCDIVHLLVESMNSLW